VGFAVAFGFVSDEHDADLAVMFASLVVQVRRSKCAEVGAASAASEQSGSGRSDEGEQDDIQMVFHAFDPFLASSSYENGKRSLQRQKNLKSSFGLIRSAWIMVLA
jgi:hypothetical protein